jgi:hypothetical protein
MRRFWYGFIVLAVAALIGLLALGNWPKPIPAADLQTLRIANELYANGEIDEAIPLYRQLVESGIRNATVYYNLGLAHNAAGQTGPAMQNFLLAESLAPRDVDIQAQLAALRPETGPRPPARDLPQRLARSLETVMSQDETAVLALGSWLLFSLLLFGVGALNPGFFRTVLRALSIIVGVFAIAGILALGARVYVSLLEPPAVVVLDGVIPSTEPGVVSEGRAALRSGAEVAVIERRGDYVNVLLPGSGNTGWLPFTAVAVTN